MAYSLLCETMAARAAPSERSCWKLAAACLRRVRTLVASVVARIDATISTLNFAARPNRLGACISIVPLAPALVAPVLVDVRLGSPQEPRLDLELEEPGGLEVHRVDDLARRDRRKGAGRLPLQDFGRQLGALHPDIGVIPVERVEGSGLHPGLGQPDERDPVPDREQQDRLDRLRVQHDLV